MMNEGVGMVPKYSGIRIDRVAVSHHHQVSLLLFSLGEIHNSKDQNSACNKGEGQNSLIRANGPEEQVTEG